MKKIKESKKIVWGVYKKNCADINYCSLVCIFEFKSWVELICAFLNAKYPNKKFIISKLAYEIL